MGTVALVFGLVAVSSVMASAVAAAIVATMVRAVAWSAVRAAVATVAVARAPDEFEESAADEHLVAGAA